MSREEGTTTPVVAARRERERAAGHGRNAEVLEFLGVLDFFLFFFLNQECPTSYKILTRERRIYCLSPFRTLLTFLKGKF